MHVGDLFPESAWSPRALSPIWKLFSFPWTHADGNAAHAHIKTLSWTAQSPHFQGKLHHGRLFKKLLDVQQEYTLQNNTVLFSVMETKIESARVSMSLVGNSRERIRKYPMQQPPLPSP